MIDTMIVHVIVWFMAAWYNLYKEIYKLLF